MNMEINLFLDAVENMEEVKLGEYYYVKGTYEGYPTVVSHTEQGVSNSGMRTDTLAVTFTQSGLNCQKYVLNVAKAYIAQMKN